MQRDGLMHRYRWPLYVPWWANVLTIYRDKYREGLRYGVGCTRRACDDFNGLGEGYSQPVALLLDEGHKTEDAANRAGYRYFTDVASFQSYVQHETLTTQEEEGDLSRP